MSRLSTREKILITIAILLGFVYLFQTYFFQPLWDRYQVTKAEVAAKNVELERLKQGGLNKKALAQNIAELEKTYQKYGDKLPDSPQTAELLYFLQDKAAKTGVTLVSMQLAGGPQVNNQTVVTPVTVETSGSYSATLNLLRELESFPRLVKVPGLTWQAVEGKITGRFQLSVYSMAASFGKKAPGPIPHGNTAPADPFIRS